METAAPEGETPNQRQARLRRERRAAKIQSEGSSRLEAISTLSGRRIPPPEQPTLTPSATASPTPFKPANVSASEDTPDPDEVDISEHHYAPRTTHRHLTPSQLQQWPGPPPSRNANNDSAANQDPMMAMMQQMLGGSMPGMDPNADPMAGMPPGFAEMFAQMNGGNGGVQSQVASTSSAYVWRIVHALFSFTLAFYITLTSSFTGSKTARVLPSLSGEEGYFGKNLFLWFATVEVALQSSRYLIEKGQLPQSGWMGTLSRLLPEPYAGYLRIVGRYSVIYNTVVADAMVVVFVLGLVAWWKGQVEV